MQNWRAVAIFDDRPDQLLFVGDSSGVVRAGIFEAFKQVFEKEERKHVVNISLQVWEGKPTAGNWKHYSNLPIPRGVYAS